MSAQPTRAIRVRTRKDLRDHLVAAPLWPLHGVNLGTLLRTCDAVGACLAVAVGGRGVGPG